MNSKKIRRSFSAAAESYDRHNAIQTAVARRLIDFLPANRQFKSILEIGCGTGIYTKMLVDKFPGSRIYSLDISPEMVNRARQHIRHENMIWLVEDAREVILEEKVSLVTGSTTVHWVNPLDELFANLNRQLYNRGQLIVNVMLRGTLTELHELRRRVAPDKFKSPLLPTRGQVLHRLDGSKLKILKVDEVEIVQEYDSAPQFLDALNEQGVAHCSEGQSIHFSRGELKELVDLYEKEFSTDKGVAATYRILELQAVKNG